MDEHENILSPDQMNSIRMFQYKVINPVVDASMARANGSLNNALMTFKHQNAVLEKNVSTLQVLLDSLMLKKDERGPELVEDIVWNHYFYKKYRYQTHIMLVIIGICIVLNILASVVSPKIFPAVAGLLLSVAFVYIVYMLWDLWIRDDQNFDEYKFGEYTGRITRQNQYNMRKSVYDTNVDISNCVVKKHTDSYKKL